MAQLRQDYDEFLNRDAEIVVIGPDSNETFQRYWKAEELPFIGLADEAGRVAKHYGQEFNLVKLGRMPALFIIDKAGVIRYAHYGQSMSDIPTNKEVLKVLDGI